MLNLLKITKKAINMISPYLPVSIYKYTGQTNNFGKIEANYNIINIDAQIQSTNKKELKGIEGIMLSDSYLTFYFIKQDLGTTDRVLKEGADFILFNNVKYKIIILVILLMLKNNYYSN